MACSDSQIDKPQRGRPKRAELSDVNINTGAQSINTERGSLSIQFLYSDRTFLCILNPLPTSPIRQTCAEITVDMLSLSTGKMARSTLYRG